MDHTWLSAGVDCIEKVKFSEQSELVAIDEKEYKYSKVEKRSSSEGEVRTIWKCTQSDCNCKIGIVGEFITKRYNIHKHPSPSDLPPFDSIENIVISEVKSEVPMEKPPIKVENEDSRSGH